MFKKGMLLVGLLLCLACLRQAAAQEKDMRISFGTHGWQVCLEQSQAGWGLALGQAGEKGFEVHYRQEMPIRVYFKTSQEDPALFTTAYAGVQPTENGWLLYGNCTLPNGACFRFEDALSAQGESLRIDRSVTCVETGKALPGYGFNTEFVWESAASSFEEQEFFAPGVWYRKNDHVVQGAIAGDPADDHFFMRQTRLGLPVVMMRDTGTHSSLSVIAVSDISSGADETAAAWLVDASVQYASLGVHRSPLSVGMIYPAMEGEVNYVDRGSAWVRRSHPIVKDAGQSYSLLTYPDLQDTYAAALEDSWRTAYDAFSPVPAPVDIQKVYGAGMSLLSDYAKNYNDGAMGLPFTIDIPDGRIDDITYQMGFIGQQIPIGSLFIRQALKDGNAAMLDKGCQIVDFWTRNMFYLSDTPAVWYDVLVNRFRNYPSYLRIMADGMEGVLRAWEAMRDSGRAYDQWLSACTRFADWLLSVQNEDGSFARAYDMLGAVVHDGRYNTTNPIRFLLRLYRDTQNKAYFIAALAAGEYAYQNIHLPYLYVGGTPDNDNTIDKEAGIQAMYAFTSLYDATGDAKWLQAARQAATYCETWVYCYAFPVRGEMAGNVFGQASIIGQSLIATGHSGADVFMAYTPAYYYRLYLYTGEKHFLDFACLMLYSTKQTTDWDGRLGYAHPGLVQEVFDVTGLSYTGLSKWLPWCSDAELEPLAYLEDLFGSMDIAAIQRLSPQERAERNTEFAKAR